MQIFLTGGFGFAGHYLVYGMLKKGYQLYLLGRAKDLKILEQRLKTLIDENEFVNPEFKNEQESFSNIVLLHGDLDKPDFGLNKKDLTRLNLIKFDLVVNCAAVLRYEEKFRDLCMNINVEGTRQCIELSVKNKCRYLHISTAFIKENYPEKGEITKEQFYTLGEFPNVYIESKAKAELLVKEYGEKFHLDYQIFRLPGLTGDSVTGFTNSIFGFYEYLAALAALKRKKITKQSIRYKAPTYAVANILPTDVAIKCVLEIAFKKNVTERIFNITDNKPVQPVEIGAMVNQLYQLNMIPALTNDEIENETRIEKLFARLTRQNAALTNRGYIFDNTNAEKNLETTISEMWEKSPAFFQKLITGFEKHLESIKQ